MIGRPISLCPRAARAAMTLGGGNRLGHHADGGDGPRLFLARPPVFGHPMMTQEHRLHLQHIIHMTLRGQLQRLAAAKPPPRPAPPRPPTVEIRIIQPGGGRPRLASAVASPQWQRETLRLLARLGSIAPAPTVPATRTRRRPLLHPPPPKPAEPRRQPAYLVLATTGNGDVAIGLSRYQPRQGTVLAYRRTMPRASGAEMQRQIQKITRQVQNRVITDIGQNIPWRGELRQALRSPDLVRLLTDQITRVIDRRGGIDQYRRGL